MKYESGCLLNSFVSTRGPSCLGLGLGVNKLACDAALGLKPFSAGPVNEYREGGSYRKGGSTPMALKCKYDRTSRTMERCCSNRNVVDTRVQEQG